MEKMEIVALEMHSDPALHAPTTPVALADFLPKQVNVFPPNDREFRDFWGNRVYLYSGAGGMVLVSSGKDGDLATSIDNIYLFWRQDYPGNPLVVLPERPE